MLINYFSPHLGRPWIDKSVVPETASSLILSVLPDSYAICRLDRGTPIPDWVNGSEFCAITRTAEGLSIVCLDAVVPDDVRAEREWRILKIGCPLELTEIGILRSLTEPLAQAAIAVFAVSTYDIDYLLVKASRLRQALCVLRTRGNQIA